MVLQLSVMAQIKIICKSDNAFRASMVASKTASAKTSFNSFKSWQPALLKNTSVEVLFQLLCHDRTGIWSKRISVFFTFQFIKPLVHCEVFYLYLASLAFVQCSYYVFSEFNLIYCIFHLYTILT